jgi:hypothetical protein
MKKKKNYGKEIAEGVRVISYAEAKNMFMEIAAANEAASKKTKKKKA